MGTVRRAANATVPNIRGVPINITGIMKMAQKANTPSRNAYSRGIGSGCALRGSRISGKPPRRRPQALARYLPPKIPKHPRAPLRAPGRKCRDRIAMHPIHRDMILKQDVGVDTRRLQSGSQKMRLFRSVKCANGDHTWDAVELLNHGLIPRAQESCSLSIKNRRDAFEARHLRQR